MYIFINMHILTFINFELYGVGLDTAIKNNSSRMHNLYVKQPPPPMATYQDGRIWRKTLHAFLKRPNLHDWIGEKQEINGCMCWMTLPEVHPIAHKTSCPEYSWLFE